MRPHHLHVTAILAVVLCAPVPGAAQDRYIDSGRSAVRVRIFTTGAIARTFEIEAPVMDGSLGVPSDPHLQIAFDARRMRVLDHPALSARDRDTVQTRMLGPDVLDVERYQWISYHSLTLDRVDGGWLVGGELNLHGQVRPLSVKVAFDKKRYTGSTTFRQSDFGIEPASAMGGAVKLKDEIEISFDIVAER
jgi:hypothetical protein